jgi:hypothetical protein
MKSLRIGLYAALVAGSVGLAGEAAAQGFFERLFGLRPAQPVYPPQPVPQRGPFGAPPGPAYPGAPPPEGEILGPVGPVAPPPPKPIVLKPPSEDSVLGRELKLNGTVGSLRLERTGRSDLRAQITLAGSKISDPTESCSVQLGDGQPLPLASQGRADGLPRYEVQAQACPIIFDVLDGAILVNAPTEACVFQAADCRVDAQGMWGPEPSGLLAKARDIEDARGTADKAVRENYKALAQRAGPQGIRPIVADQAAFSADRETMCRSYRREAAHGFCNTRFTEGRAVTLAARLGLLSTAPESGAQTPRPRPPRQTAQPMPAPAPQPPAPATVHRQGLFGWW